MFKLQNIYFGIVIISVFYIKTALGYFEVCDQTFSVAVGGSAIINSPNYPNYQYAPGSSCRYLVTAPSGYMINLTCTISMPALQNACSTDVFYIATDGNKTLNNAQYYCGTGLVTSSSLFNKIVFAYISNTATSSGSFTCTATANPQPCDCGWSVTTKITGGVQTQPNEFVSMAGIVDKPSSLVFCGGAIINYRYVLTAAHCFLTYNNPTNIWVLVGEQDYTIGTETFFSDLLPISGVKIHESYNSATQANDIALITMLNDISYGRGVGPACLPYAFSSSTLENNLVDVAGWGTTSFGGPITSSLRKVSLAVISNYICSLFYSSVTNQQVCTFTQGKDACQYDSGGNLYIRSGRLYTVGIVSYGSACGVGQPAVNTRVTSYLNWITQNSNGAMYCVK